MCVFVCGYMCCACVCFCVGICVCVRARIASFFLSETVKLVLSEIEINATPCNTLR